MRAAAWTQRKLRRITARGSCPDPWRAGSAASSTPLAELPLFLDPAEAGLDRLQAVVQPQARGLEPAVVGQGAAHRRAVALHDLQPCTICAAASLRPSILRSIGRTPRTIFF